MTMARPPDEVFDEAIRQSPGSDRAAFLNQACGNDGELRGRVEQLLRAYDDAGSFLETPADRLAATSDRPSISEQPGSVIGPYKLLQQIGEGGFGVVFLAEQERPVRRRVALKVIKPGMDTREVIARFEAERQALALMDHPNIAKVLDAGTTNCDRSHRVDRSLRERGNISRSEMATLERGNISRSEMATLERDDISRSEMTTISRPYFVMELVQGVPITEYCDQCNLTTDERLELFVSVCQAVQHAHQKGVIHRDIKPTNVLVAIQDGQPAPKIIDFGVAKAINQQLTEHTLMTAFAQMVGTPLYMSPEQAELSPLGVDTRTDIYSLGVLLYELLTSTTPFDRNRLHSASYDELRRIIREEEPPRPSARISTLAADLATTVADHRRTDVRRLRQTVRGELDWIVMKCLEKDRNRRYETANGLAHDIKRYLHDEPVQACPPSVAYRAKKLIRRNKVGVAAGSAVILALVGGLALATVGFVQARRQARISAAEAAKATAISELLQTALQSANPDQVKGPDYTVRQLLDDFAGGMGNQLVGQPEVEAQIRAIIGNAYNRLGQFELAAAQFEAALAIRRRVSGYQPEVYAGILVDYAQNLAEQSLSDDAERTAREAVDIYRRAGISGRPLVKALWILQLQLAFRADFADETVRRAAYAEEQALVDEALAIAHAEGVEYPELANMLHRHAPLMSRMGDGEGAEECAQRAVAMHRRMHGNEHPETAYGLADLGRVLRDRKKNREAESAFREALKIFRSYYGDNYSVILGIQGELDRAILAQGESAVRETQKREPLEAPNHAKQIAGSVAANRSVRLAQDALEREIREALSSFENDLESSPDNKAMRLRQATTYRQIAEFSIKQGNTVEAIDCLQKAVSLASSLAHEEPTDSSFAEERLRSQFSLADTLAREGRVEEFLTAFKDLLDVNADTMSLLQNQTATLLLSGDDTCVRIVKVLKEFARRVPENAEQAHRLFNRTLKQLETVSLVSTVEQSLKTADIYIRLGQGLGGESTWSTEMLEVERQLRALLEAVLDKYPGDILAREQVGHKYRLWAFALPWSEGYLTHIEDSLREAVKVFAALTVDFPDNASAWHFLGDTYCRLGNVFASAGKAEEAKSEYRRAVTLFDEHIAMFDTTPINDSERALSYLELASFIVRIERRKDAEEYFRKALQILDRTSAQPDLTKSYPCFAYYFAKAHREQEAGELVRKALIDTKRVTDPNALADAYYFIALAQLRLEDTAGYRATCKALFDVPVGDQDDSAKSRPIWTACLAPGSLEDLTPLVTRAEEYVTNISRNRRHFGLYVLGAALYRAGRYERAAARLGESDVAFQRDPLPPGAGFEGRNYQQLLLAMARWQLGQHDDARQLLAETLPAVEAELQSPTSSWNRRATLELLRAEAKSLTAPDEAEEATEKGIPPQSAPTTND